MPNDRAGPLIGSKEAADILGVDKATVTRWVASGRISPVHKLTGPFGAFVFSRAEIMRLARDRIAAREGAA